MGINFKIEIIKNEYINFIQTKVENELLSMFISSMFLERPVEYIAKIEDILSSKLEFFEDEEDFLKIEIGLNETKITYILEQKFSQIEIGQPINILGNPLNHTIEFIGTKIFIELLKKCYNKFCEIKNLNFFKDTRFKYNILEKNYVLEKKIKKLYLLFETKNYIYIYDEVYNELNIDKNISDIEKKYLEWYEEMKKRTKWNSEQEEKKGVFAYLEMLN